MANLLLNTIITVSQKQHNTALKQQPVWYLGFVLWFIMAVVLLPTPLAAAPTEADEQVEHADNLEGLSRDETLCGSTAYRIGDTELCTYGPEEIHTDSTEALHAAAQAGSSVDSIVCEGNGVSGERVQVLYVRAEDQPDHYAENLAFFRQVALEADQIFDQSAHQTGDHRRVRYVTDADCQLDVLHIVIGAAEGDTFTDTVQALRMRGFNEMQRKYLMFMESNIYCGIASSVDDDRPGAENRSNLIPGYARIDRICWSAKAVAHELAHTFGAVQHSAPNASGGWHCTDGHDLLCYSDTPYYPQIQTVCTDSRYRTLLDCNHDDYFHTRPPAGSYLAEHWNLADSAFLIKTPEDHVALPLMKFSVPTVRGQLITGNKVVLSLALLNSSQQQPEDVIQQVEFFQDGISLGVITEAPYEFAWQPTEPGQSTLTALVTDHYGASQTLEPVTVNITSLQVHSQQLERGGIWVTLLPIVSN